MHTKNEPLPSAAYHPVGADNTYQSSVLTRGPWNPEHQHAGPPIALACRAIEAVAHTHGLTHLSRLTANLLRPVPISALTVQVTTDYVGRNAGHFSAQIIAHGKEVARFTALAQREASIALPKTLAGHPLAQIAVAAEDSPPAIFPFAGRHVGYSDLVETRAAHGHIFDGPCAIWFRLRYPLLDTEETSPYQRVAVAADSGNGISAVLDLAHFSFVNSDLTINLLRRPVGEWICLEARSYLGDNGCGLAESALYDHHGLIGRATQSLAVRALHAKHPSSP
ncbi:MAG: thioesterase family protein [Burkholderiales bacterium]|nr:thioesterase family protein [Burkholderiales bacterium]